LDGHFLRHDGERCGELGFVLHTGSMGAVGAGSVASHGVANERCGHLYYLSPGIGWYMNNDVLITFALLGILALIMFIHRDKIEWVR
jgi:hypothetical protein